MNGTFQDQREFLDYHPVIFPYKSGRWELIIVGQTVKMSPSGAAPASPPSSVFSFCEITEHTHG